MSGVAIQLGPIQSELHRANRHVLFANHGQCRQAERCVDCGIADAATNRSRRDPWRARWVYSYGLYTVDEILGALGGYIVMAFI